MDKVSHEGELARSFLLRSTNSFEDLTSGVHQLPDHCTSIHTGSFARLHVFSGEWYPSILNRLDRYTRASLHLRVASKVTPDDEYKTQLDLSRRILSPRRTCVKRTRIHGHFFFRQRIHRWSTLARIDEEDRAGREREKERERERMRESTSADWKF